MNDKTIELVKAAKSGKDLNEALGSELLSHIELSFDGGSRYVHPGREVLTGPFHGFVLGYITAAKDLLSKRKE